MKILSTVLVLSVLYSYVLGVCPSTTATTTWSSLFGGSPTTADLTINAGTIVKLDTSATVHSLTINGGLVWDESINANFTARWIKVNSGGSFIIGSTDCQYSMKAYITFTGTRSTVSEMGNEPTDGVALGTKGLAITSGGTVELHGNVVSPSWTRIASTVNAGASTITLQTAVNWKVGDRIVITNTDFGPVWDQNLVPDQNEDRYITAIDQTKTVITLSSPLTYMHWGAGYEVAEVGLLTRSIVFTGDSLSDTDGFGGHFIIRRPQAAHIEGVEFTKMGQKNLLARYPIHFHMLRDVTNLGYYVKDSSVHHTYQRCLVIHNTNGLLVQNVVGFDSIGHCFFLEDGAEMYNTWENNLGVLARPGQLIPSDAKPSVFWITNPHNTFHGNTAVGGTFGFWFSLPDKPVGASASEYAATNWVWPKYIPLLSFDNNIAHGCDRNGLMVDEMIDINGDTPLGDYSPKQGPYNDTTQPWEYYPEPATFTNFIGYKCRENGVWTRGSWLHVKDVVLLDNQLGILTVPGPSFVENAYIVGETDNIGTPTHYNWLPDMPRSRPVYWTNDYPVLGWSGYDAGGPQFAKNITLENFQTNVYRPAGGISVLPNGKNILYPSDALAEFTFINANEVFLQSWPNTYDSSLLADGPKGVNLGDMDGRITGFLGGWVISNTSLMVRPDCVAKPSWNGYACPSFRSGFVQLEIQNDDTVNTDFGTTVSGNEYVRATFYKLGSPSTYLDVTGGDTANVMRNRYTANVESHNGYTIRWPHPSPPSITVTMGGAAEGDWVLVAIPYPSTTFTITTLSPGWSSVSVTPTTSIDQVDKYHYYYDSATQHLWVKVENQVMGAQTSQWNFNYRDSYGSYTTIVAGCGTSCSVGGGISGNPTPAIPAAQPTGEDSYQASLGTCGFTPSVTSNNYGVAYFDLNPKTHTMTYLIYHTIDASKVTEVSLWVGNTKFYTFPSALTNNKGVFALSRYRTINLWNGEIDIVISSTDFPNGELKGKVGCVGVCSAPEQISAQDPCTPAGSSLTLYTDITDSQWNSGVWVGGQGTYVMYDTTKALCGSKSFKINWNGNMDAYFYKSSAFTIDTSVYNYLQFYAIAETIPVRMTVMFQPDSSTNGPYVYVEPKYIENYVIENTNWTRVRVPVADLGMVGVQNFYQLNLVQYNSWDVTNNPPASMWIDEIRFVADTTEPMTDAFTGSASAYADACAIFSTSGTASATATSGTSGLTGSSSGTVSGSSSGTVSSSSSSSSSSGSSSGTGTGVSTGRPAATTPTAVQSSGGLSGTTLYIVIGAGGGGLLFIVAVIVAVVLIKKKRNGGWY